MLARASSALPSINLKNLSSLPIIFCRENISEGTCHMTHSGLHEVYCYVFATGLLRNCDKCPVSATALFLTSSKRSPRGARDTSEEKARRGKRRDPLERKKNRPTPDCSLTTLKALQRLIGVRLLGHPMTAPPLPVSPNLWVEE